MSKKINIYDVTTDVTTINFNIDNANILISSTQENTLTLKYVGTFIHVANTDGELVVKQDRRPFANLRKPVAIRLEVPQHLVPSLFIYARKIELTLDDGIFAQFEIYAKHGKITLGGAAFENVDVKGESVQFAASNLTVKNTLLCNIEGGESIIENCFARVSECRNKNGNVGAINLNCKDSLFEAENGNISATVLGDKKDFNISVTAKNGTCNCENSLAKTTNSFKAYTTNGNISADFIKEEVAEITEPKEDKEQSPDTAE
jgi:hypothetical protein